MAELSDKNILQHRTAGVLMHISSLPSAYGIGDLGKSAFDFANFIAASGLTFWQILPLVPTDDCNSPYSSWTALGGNPLFIDLDMLKNNGLLSADDIAAKPIFSRQTVEFGKVADFKLPLLYKAATNLLGNTAHSLYESFNAFCKDNDFWLHDVALFSVIFKNTATPWWEWDAPLRDRQLQALKVASKHWHNQIMLEKVIQFFFAHQWNALRQYCRNLGIFFIGDVPIYVSANSVDVWANQKLFKLNEKKQATHVAGVPPDAFSDAGQFWGNPIYNWEEHQKSDYDWWLLRLGRALACTDIVRIDHFRGLSAYWEVPAEAPNASFGQWVKGPGHSFVEAIKKAYPHLPIMAEDLGYLDDEVHALRDKHHLAGMLILQFAFGIGASASYLPHNHSKNKFVYPGTHDNDTILGWWTNLSENTRIHVRKYLGKESVDERDIVNSIIKLGFASVANHVVIAMQDFLGCDASCRMNTPGVESSNNWAWRMDPLACGAFLSTSIKELTNIFERNPKAG